MHHRAKDLTGMRINFLTAISYAGSDGSKSIWNIACDCGKSFEMPATEFLKRKCHSCGCMKKKLIGKKNTTHGFTDHPAYWVWRSMKNRCLNPSSQAWKNYGGRGITICRKWVNSFSSFWKDMGPTYQSGLTLERKDVNGDYEKSNCKWATMKRQANNRRLNLLIETPAGKMTAAEAADLYGIKRTTLYRRIAVGCPTEKLFERANVTNRFK